MNEITTIIDIGKEVISSKDANFLSKNIGSLNKVFKNTFMWRTNIQKQSIISNEFFPTIHGKFHQSILEQKVQLDQAIYLIKDYELKKLDIEEKEEELNNHEPGSIKSRRIAIEIKFFNYELENMKIAMTYRMKEVKGWQQIIDELYSNMIKSGLTDIEIWNKEELEIREFFFRSLNMVQGVKVTKDSGELSNLIGLARFAVESVQRLGILEKLIKECDNKQLDSLVLLGIIKPQHQASNT